MIANRSRRKRVGLPPAVPVIPSGWFAHGTVTVDDEETAWRFIPAEPWHPGAYRLVIGTIEQIGGKEFCAAEAARSLAGAAKDVGAGRTFSVAVVFARQEFETWLIAGVASLAGRRLPDGRRIDANAMAPAGDLEAGPGDAKGWLRAIVDGGYKPTRDQAALTRLVDLQVIRDRDLRSFRRFESAVLILIEAIRSNAAIASPP
jgi:hypothetical protein